MAFVNNNAVLLEGPYLKNLNNCMDFCGICGSQRMNSDHQKYKTWFTRYSHLSKDDLSLEIPFPVL